MGLKLFLELIKNGVKVIFDFGFIGFGPNWANARKSTKPDKPNETGPDEFWSVPIYTSPNQSVGFNIPPNQTDITHRGTFSQWAIL